MMNLFFTRYKKIFFTIFACVILIIAQIITVRLGKNSSNEVVITNTHNSTEQKKSNMKNTIISDNIESYISEIPDSYSFMLYNTLFAIASDNNKHLSDHDVRNISDFKIRDNTYKVESFNDLIKRSNFIVDSETLRQSYQVRLYWSYYPRNVSQLYGENAIIECPTKEILIYEDFECHDYGEEEDMDV